MDVLVLHIQYNILNNVKMGICTCLCTKLIYRLMRRLKIIQATYPWRYVSVGISVNSQRIKCIFLYFKLKF